jgi:uncharacterized protein YoxC
MSNYNIVLEQQAIQTDAAGLASQRYTIYMQSLEAASNQLKTAWQEMWSKSVTQDMIKDILNAITSIIELISGSGGLIPVLTMGVGAFIAFKNTTIAVSAATGAMGLSFSTALGPIGLVVAAIGLAIIAYNNFHKSAQEIKADMEEGKSTLEENTKELENIKARYEELSQKQNKNRDDLKELVEMQNTVNLKYQAAKEGIDLYTSAVDNNSDAIQKNIDKLDAQIKKEAERYLKVNKPGYQEAQSYLAETEYIAPSGIMGNVVGENVSKQDYLDYLAEQISLYGDYNGRLKDEYDRISENIKIYQEIIDIYNEYSSILSGNTVALDENYDAGIGGATALAELTYQEEEAVQATEDLAASSESLSSAMDAVAKAASEQAKEGQISNATALDLISANADLAMYLVKTADGYLFDAEAAKQATYNEMLNVFTKKGIASAAVAAANGNYVFAQSAIAASSATDTEKASMLGLLKAFAAMNVKVSVPSSSGGGTSSAESVVEKLNKIKKQAYEDEIKGINKTIDAYEDQIDALEAQKDAYNEIIDAKKESLRLSKEEDDYQSELEDKNKELADIDNELFAIQSDNSQEATAKRIKLEEEKAEKIEEIAEYQADRTYEIEIDALDREAEAYEKMIDMQIAGVQQIIDGYKSMIASINEAIDAMNRLASAGSGGGGSTSSTSGKSTTTFISTVSNAEWDKIVSDPGYSKKGYSSGGSGKVPPGHPNDSALIPVESDEVFAVLNKSQQQEISSNPVASMMQTIMGGKSISEVSSLNTSSGEITVGDLIFNVSGNMDKSLVPQIEERIFEALNKINKERGLRTNVFQKSV